MPAAGRCAALILEAPHVFVEDITVASIAEAKTAYDDDRPARSAWRAITTMPTARSAAGTTSGSHPDFRAWNIEECLPGVRCPVLAIQGDDDEYGTLAQLDAIERGVPGPFERLVLASCKHSPHRDQEAAVLEAMARFIARV